MLTFQWRSTITDTPLTASIAAANPDLAIRSLLDDPQLRRAMATAPSAAPTAPAAEVAKVLPQPVLNRRRLLERAAA